MKQNRQSEPAEPLQEPSSPSAQQQPRSPRKTPAAARGQQHKVLYRISDLINSTVNSTTLLRRIVRETVDAFGASGGLIAFPDPEQPHTLRVEVDQRIDARNLRTGTLLPPDHIGVQAFTADAVRHHELTKPRVKTEMAAPLKVDGKPTGVLCIRWRTSRPIIEDDERLLAVIASQAARVIHTARLYSRLSRQTQRLENLFEVAQNLISNDPISTVLNRVTESLLSILDVKQCTVLLVGKGHELQLSASSGGGGNTYAQRREIGTSLVERLSSRGEPVRVLDVKKSDGRRPGKAPRVDRNTSLLAVPIFYQNSLVGILNVYTEQPRNYEQEEMQLLKAYASLCGVAIENARQHEQLLNAAEEVRQADKFSTLKALAGESSRIVRDSLTASRLIIDSLHEQGAFPAGQADQYQLLQNNISTIQNVVSATQEIASIRPSTLEWVDVNRLADGALALYRHRLATREIVVHRRYTADLPRTLADAGELQAIMLQVINNAMENMRHGGLLNISTTLLEKNTNGTVEQPMIRINIRDTGAGIHPDIAEQIMTPFARQPGTRMGAGLFTAQQSIKKIGGRFTVRNAADHGTSISITLPAGPA